MKGRRVGFAAGVFALIACTGASETVSKTLDAAGQAADAPRLADAQAELEREGQALVVAMKRIDDPAFGDSDRATAVRSGRRALEILNENPELLKGKLDKANELKRLVDFLDSTTIGTVAVDARSSAQTGISVEKGWLVKAQAIEGKWTASSGSSDWPPVDPNVGYPKYKPGLLLDWRSCTAAPMGALTIELGDRCGGVGGAIRHGGAPAILELGMSDNARNNNAGKITARYVVFRKPDLLKSE